MKNIDLEHFRVLSTTYLLLDVRCNLLVVQDPKADWLLYLYGIESPLKSVSARLRAGA